MLDSLGALAGPLAYLLVGALAGLESAAFVGLFVPGELALLTGGYIAYRGNANLGLMMAIGAIGAIAGDSIGYEIGRHFGPALQRSRLGRKVGEERWQRAQAYLAAKGGRAVFAGRFIGVLRALVPALAGAGRMPYRQFLAWNAAGAVIWAPGTVLAGFLAGSSYKRVERYAGRAGLVLLGVIVVLSAVVLCARWIAEHPERVRGLAARLLERPRIAALTRRYRAQIDFLVDRFRPGNALGLVLTAQLVVLAAAGWVFGTLVLSVLGGGDAARLDLPAVRYLAEHRAGWLTTAMRATTTMGSSVSLLPAVLVVGMASYRRARSWAALAQLLVVMGGAVALYQLVKVLVARPRPDVSLMAASASGYAFPSGHTTQTTAVAISAALLLASWTRRWPRKVTIWAAAVLLCLAVGFSRVYLGVHWPTDVLAGYALGALWASTCALAARTARQRRGARCTGGTDGGDDSASVSAGC